MDSINILEQTILCENHGVIPVYTDDMMLIGLGRNFQPNLQINGLRHNPTKIYSGWFIWSGDDFDVSDSHFFEPTHTFHIIELTPFIFKYLGLPPGYRFLIDKYGYEDIWFDEQLLEI